MYVEILVEIKSKHIDKTFTYYVNDELKSRAKVGCRALVPFGRQTLEGYITNIKKETNIETKDIISIIDDEPILNEEMLELGKYLKETTLCSLSSAYSSMLPKALKAKAKVNMKPKTITYLEYINPNHEKTTKTQNLILDLFKDNKKVLKSEALSISKSSTQTLIKNGILKEFQEEVYRYIPKDNNYAKEITLNTMQEYCVNEITKSLTNEVYLLHGVTGSGKTEVYIECIKKVIKNGKTAIVLVPEISLTPQLIERFYHAFKSDIAVLHSSLSDGERYDEYRRIMREEAHVVIGTRSAIFAPLKNIGIIIIDEEHSEAYKQENNPKYDAREVAKERAKYHNCPLVLASATPSITSLARSMKHVYHYLSMPKRANASLLPEVTVVDMAEENKTGHAILSRELEYRIIECLEHQEQVMILLNRRGHSTTITCSSCGYTYKCPYCDISLTYHKTSKNLRCHYCGYTKYVSDTCPNCHEKSLNYYGLGTEKLEDYLREVFPRARVIRMDRDSTTKKGSHEKITSAFESQEYDILVGTQMISKGLDFNNVTLVGILNADASLNIPDYRSSERTFSLLHQACGRAGRGLKKGSIILQTFYPDNYIIKCVSKNDYKSFVKYEMNVRRTLKYPPFYRMITIRIMSKDYSALKEESLKIKEFLKNHVNEETIILGPSTANMFLVSGIYHFEILTKYKFDDKIKPALEELDNLMNLNNKVWIDYEFDS